MPEPAYLISFPAEMQMVPILSGQEWIEFGDWKAVGDGTYEIPMTVRCPMPETLDAIRVMTEAPDA